MCVCGGGVISLHRERACACVYRCRGYKNSENSASSLENTSDEAQKPDAQLSAEGRGEAFILFLRLASRVKLIWQNI